jgi:hypothetical protein
MVEEILGLMDKTTFTQLVEGYISKDKMGPIEAIVTVCEENNLEVTEVSKFLSASLLAKLEAEAMERNYIPRTNQLPV